MVDGDRSVWIARCETALVAGGFKDVATNSTIGQIDAKYHKATTWGTLTLTLLPEVNGATRFNARATANVDNAYALFRSPTKKILDAFKAGLASA